MEAGGEVGPEHLRRFLAAESERRPAASSQARTVAALKGFFRFLVDNKAIDRNPALVPTILTQTFLRYARAAAAAWPANSRAGSSGGEPWGAG